MVVSHPSPYDFCSFCSSAGSEILPSPLGVKTPPLNSIPHLALPELLNRCNQAAGSCSGCPLDAYSKVDCSKDLSLCLMSYFLSYTPNFQVSHASGLLSDLLTLLLSFLFPSNINLPRSVCQYHWRALSASQVSLQFLPTQLLLGLHMIIDRSLSILPHQGIFWILLVLRSQPIINKLLWFQVFQLLHSPLGFNVYHCYLRLWVLQKITNWALLF